MESATLSPDAVAFAHALPSGAAILSPRRDRSGRVRALMVEAANATALDLLGRSAGDVLGRPVEAAGAFDDAGDLDRLIALAEGGARSVDLGLTPAAGAPLRLRAARCGGAVAVSLAPADPPASEALALSMALETGRIGTWQAWPLEGRLHWSRAECDLMGVAPEAFGGRMADFHARLPPEIVERAPIVDAALRETGEYTAVTPIVRPDGARRWIRERCRVAGRRADGTPSHVIGVSHDITDEIEALERAQRAEVRLRGAIDVLPDAFVIYDADDRLALCNDAYRRFYARSAELIAPGARFEDVIRGGVARGQYPEAVGREEAWIAERLSLHAAAGRDGIQRLEGGRWIRLVERRTEQGDRVGLRIDVTELVDAQRRAETAEARLRAALEAAPFGIGVFDADGVLALCNARYGATAPGAAEAIAPGMSYAEIMRRVVDAGEYPDHETDAEAWIARKIARQAEGCDCVEPRANDRWVRCIDAPSATGDRVAFRIDVTEERRRVVELGRIAAELAERERELAGFFDVSLDLLGIAGADGRLLRLNQAWADSFGHGVEVLRGLTIFELIHPDDVEAMRAAFAGLASGSPAVELLTRGARDDGGAIWIEWRCASGPEGRVYVAARDVTARIESATRRERRIARDGALSRVMGLALQATDATAFLDAALEALLVEGPWLGAVVGGAVFLAEEPGTGGLKRTVMRGLDSAGSLLADAAARACAARARGAAPDAAAAPAAGASAGDGATCCACAPILGRERLLGVLTLRAATGFFETGEEAAFLARLGDALALGLGQRRAMAETEAARRRAEEAVAELRTYQDALEAHAILSETDADGVITKVNPKFCAATGYAEAELLGRTHRLVNSGTHPRAYFEAMWRRIAAGDSWRGVICDRAKSGALAWFDTTIFPVRDADGAIRRYVSLRFDVSARVLMSERLSRANAELDEVAEIAGLGGWAHVVDTGEIRWDERTRRLFDAAPDFRPTVESTRALLGADGRAGLSALIAAAAASGEGFDAEIEARTFGGREIWIRVSGRAVRESGRIVRIAGVVQDVTERKTRDLTNERLRQRVEAIFRHTDAVIFLKDRAGRFLFGNPKFLSELGVDEVRGLTDFDLMPRAEAEALAAVERRIFETGAPMTGEETVVRPDGSTHAFSSSKFLIPDPETGDVVMCAVATDISERKRREAEVERLRERFQTVFDNADSAIFVKRRDGTYVTANRAFLGYHGMSGETDLAGLRNEDLFPPDLAARFTASDVETFRTGALQRTEEEAVDPSGRRRHFLTSKFLVPDVESGDRVLCGVAIEVTEQRERELENQRLQARFEAVFQTSDAAISLRTRDNRVIAANRRMLTLFGADAGPAREYLAPEAQRLVIEAARRIFASGRPERSEETYRTADGSDRTFVIARALVADPVVGEDLLLTLATDITDQKALQAEAVASQREAERANAAKSTFLATMSHEIRTPLNGVLGMAGLLEREAVGERAQHMIGVIRQSGEALLTLLNDILDFSRVESGKLALETQSFDAGVIARRVADVHELKAREKGLGFALRVADEAREPWLGDPHRIQQILHNLVGNAVKFTERGSVDVELGLDVGEAGGPPALRFEVRDTGIGMTEEEVARVFDVFAQADASMTRRFGGTGLGLSIAKRLAEAMGGRIAVRSRAGEGSTFVLTLPRGRGEAAAASAE